MPFYDSNAYQESLKMGYVGTSGDNGCIVTLLMIFSTLSTLLTCIALIMGVTNPKHIMLLLRHGNEHKSLRKSHCRGFSMIQSFCAFFTSRPKTFSFLL